MIRPGEQWGSPAGAPADLEVAGGDAALARAAAAAPGALLRFRPDSSSDLAKAVGLRAGGLRTGDDAVGTALTLDALGLADGTLACNMCVLGAAPDRLRWSSRSYEMEVRLDGEQWFVGTATTVVVAIGQFLRGLDVVPRGHPGDGRAEIQLYELRRSERRSMRARLSTGSHVPHPRIRQRSARRVEVRARRALRTEVDGEVRLRVTDLAIEVIPGAYRLLI